jgi:hypothetical protein
MSVKFFTTQRLAGKFCEGGCSYRTECNPVATNNGENDMSGLNVLVVGNIVATECPIMARVWPFAGWIDAQNHLGRCGEQDR